jgi:tRNA (guanine26-N2/guanine27-N2)-dimethyltransferase
MKKIQEGSAFIEVPEETKVSRKLEVFYNPAMKLNRDLTILLLNAVDNRQMLIADIMAGTGVRSIRMLKELKRGKVKRMYVNDLHSIEKAKKNFKANKVKGIFSSELADLFLLKSNGFDYIDIDPFGTPNDFLDAAAKRIARNGILGITATDTAALCGTHPKTGIRNYWAAPFRNGFMHESALRILAHKVQLIGAQYDKALIPIFSYAREHYVRVFFRCIKGRTRCDELLKQHKYLLYNPKTLGYEVSERNFKEGHVAIGPLWAGSLHDKNIVKKMLTQTKDKEAAKLLTTIYNELDVVGCYDVHELCKALKVKVPNYESLLQKAHGSRTHDNHEAIKTNMSLEKLKLILRQA